MRLVGLAPVLLSLAFAPAPFPRSERPPRESEQARRGRLLYQCRLRLDELGVEWRLEQHAVTFTIRRPGGGTGGS